MNTPLPTVAITLGEPAGIGPELCAMIADRHARAPFPARLVFVGDGELFAQRAARIGLALRLAEYEPASFAPAGGVCEVWHQPLAAPPVPGHPDTTNAYSTIAMLGAAADACAAGEFDALVTAPVQKSALVGAGIPFSGHTEFFARRAGVPRVVMMLVGGAEPPSAAGRAGDHAPAAVGGARGDHARRGRRDDRHRRRRARSPGSGSTRRASPSAASIRTPARTATSAARRST